MCLGLPGIVVEVSDLAGLRMGWVDFGGVRKEVCLSYVPEAEPGDYVIVHVGFAISQIDEEEARRMLGLLKEMGEPVQEEIAWPRQGVGETAGSVKPRMERNAP